MSTLKLSLEYKILEPRVPLDSPPLIILLHGYGSDENDLFSFANELNPTFRVVSFKAPYVLPWGGNAWYEIKYNADSVKWTNTEEALLSLGKIEENIKTLQAHFKTSPSKTFLLGFSQGAILSYALSMWHPHLVHNILALSGYVDQQIFPKTLDITALNKLQLFVSHGIQDPVIPIDWARKSETFLKENKIEHVYHEYQMAHGINANCFQDFVQWIAKRLK